MPGSEGFGEHCVLVAGNVGAAGSTQIEHRSGAGGRLRAPEVACHEASNVFGKRQTQIARPLSRAALNLGIQGDLSAGHHDGTIISQTQTASGRRADYGLSITTNLPWVVLTRYPGYRASREGSPAQSRQTMAQGVAATGGRYRAEALATPV